MTNEEIINKNEKKPARITERGFYLGITKDDERLYLKPFSFDCGWYWGGGYVGNAHSHSHFSQFNEKTNYYDGLKAGFKDLRLSDSQIWRLADLFKQFYTLKECAEIFKHGGHYTSDGRTKAELSLKQYKFLTLHIGNVIIPEIYKVLEWNNLENHAKEMQKVKVELNKIKRL